MLKKITIQDLRLGMHLHELCGPWLDHPFWRSRFLLNDPADLARLHGSGIQECWIDNAKGLDVAPPASPAEALQRQAPAAEARQAGMAGLLHDMGKALMPLDVLDKPGKLSDAEFAIIKQHPERGHELLAGGSATAVALDVCLHHHERPDGKGYPFGLSGSALTLQARMGAVCDVYDAVTSNRPCKSGRDPAESIAQIADWARKGQFDPPLMHAFVASLGIYPIGSLVRLRSARLAVVVEQNPAALASPRVRVFFSTRAQMPVPHELIDLNHRGCTERITGRESNSVWQFKHLDELWAGPEALDKAGRPGARRT